MMFQGKKQGNKNSDYVLKTDYVFLEEKYKQSVESYDDLLHQFKQLQRAQFGSKSERFTEILNGQQALFEPKEFEGGLEDEDDGDDPDPSGGTDVKGHTRKNKNHVSKYDHLPTREEIIPVEESERNCKCGCEKKVVGFETKWLLHYIPAVFERILQKREKVSCPRCKEKITTALVVPHILPKSEVSEELLAHIIISKFIDRQPFYHMEKYWKERFGVRIARQTMAKWVIESAKKMTPLINIMKEEILGYHISSVDATSIQVLHEENRKATTSSYMYCVRGGPSKRRCTIYDYNAKKHKQFVQDWYSGFNGSIHSDAQDIFTNLNDVSGIAMSYCNAHARRKFEPIAKGAKAKGLAYEAMRFFKKLYRIEAKAKEAGISYEDRQKMRQEESRPIVDLFYKWLIYSKEIVLPQSPLGKAIQYSLNHWDGLTLFLTNGELEIDNNATEREIKLFVMARKNFLFSCSVEGAEALAIYFSLIQTARNHGIEPCAYLTAIFKAIPTCKSFDDFEQLLPWNYQKKQTSSYSDIALKTA